MIKIRKSETPPIVLKKGEEETLANIFKIESGDKKIEFKKSIYADKTVKDKLKKEQFGKCCYCEGKMLAHEYGNVEHFRPKRGYQQRKNDKVKKPGYYWMAYDWNNLFLSCQICNSKYKKNYFPLEDEKKRANHNNRNIKNETPLLLHPANDDPENHISYRENVCISKNKSNKGRKSIAGFGLNRRALLESRKEFLGLASHNVTFANLNCEEMDPKFKSQLLLQFKMKDEMELIKKINTARQFISKAAKESSKFAGMIRANFQDFPK